MAIQITNGSFTRSVTTGVQLVEKYAAHFDSTRNRIHFVMSAYLKVSGGSKSVSIALTNIKDAEITTQTTNAYGNLETQRVNVCYRTQPTEEGSTYGGSATLANGEHLIVSYDSSQHITTSSGNSSPEYFTAKSKDSYEFKNPFKFLLGQWTITVGGTAYTVAAETFEIDPINLDKRVIVSMPSTYIGDYGRITATKIDSSFSYTLTAKFGNLTETIATKTTASTLSWLVPGYFLDEIEGDATTATGTFICETFNSSGASIGTTTANFTVILDVSLSGPTFSPTVEDTNSVTLALTGNSNTLVKYFSNAYVTSGAAAQGNATIKSQSIDNAGKIINSGSGTFNNVESNIFRFSATDSRLFTTATTYTASWIPYSKLTCNLITGYPMVDGTMSFKIEGNFYNNSFGAVDNTLTVQYRYKLEGGTYGDWVTVAADGSDSNYVVEITLTNFDYKQAYVFQARAIDALITIESQENIVIGYPVFDWGQYDFKFNVDVKMREDLEFANDGIIYGTDTNGYEHQAFTPCDSVGNLVIGYGGYDKEEGATMIYGNHINLFSSAGDISLNGYSMFGSWTPRCNSCTNPTQAEGMYLRIGDVCIVSFYISGTNNVTTTNGTYLQITGLPFAADTSLRWQAGGGNCSGYRASGAAFVGWSIENNIIYARTQPNTTASTSAANSNYVNGVSGDTLYASGTIMYKVA